MSLLARCSASDGASSSQCFLSPTSRHSRIGYGASVIWTSSSLPASRSTTSSRCATGPASGVPCSRARRAASTGASRIRRRRRAARSRRPALRPRAGRSCGSRRRQPPRRRESERRLARWAQVRRTSLSVGVARLAHYDRSLNSSYSRRTWTSVVRISTHSAPAASHRAQLSTHHSPLTTVLLRVFCSGLLCVAASACFVSPCRAV